MMMIRLTCIVCPQGCAMEASLSADGELTVDGNRCNRGKLYAQEEICHPVRTLTTTVKVRNGIQPLVPAKSRQPIPKEAVRKAMEEIVEVVTDAPVESGQVLIENLAGTGIALVATRGVELYRTG